MMLPGTPGRWIVSVLVVVLAVTVGVVVTVRVDDTPDRAAVKAPPPVALEQLRPLPQDAKDDRPAFYDNGSGCQVEDGDPVPVVCTSGDKTADRTIMLVGDSKIAQWETAYSDLGWAGGWRVDTVTKSACPFADVEVTDDGEVRDDCRDWGRAALREVLAAKPDVVVTSQRADAALLADGTARTSGEMIRGLHAYWQQLLDAGISVVVHLDNPFPTTHPVYRCVEENPHDVGRCAFRLDVGVEASAAPVLREAAETLPGVRIVDMAPTICPDDGWCPAVIGDVLVYRAGSHLTRTFTVSVERQLGRELAAATGGRFAATPR
ncbi:MAG: SGNH hydrolase domain-containing protein [Aeromicrobium sp.]